MQLSSMSLGLTRPQIFGGSSPVNPLRFASPLNYMTTRSGASASTTYLNQRGRVFFRIGSADMSQLILSFNGWYLGNDATNMENAYSVVKIAIEKDGATSSTPVTFTGGRTITINPGDVDIQCDPILPSAFGLQKFTRGDKYWIRFEYAVASAGLKLPTGTISYRNQNGTGAIGLTIDPATFVGGAVDSYGAMAYTSGWTEQQFVYVPIVLGRAVSGDIKSFAGAGDSIFAGLYDTLTGYGMLGGFMQALHHADHVSNPLAGCDFGVSGMTSAIWNGTNKAKVQAYLKYATYVVDEFGTNNFGGAPGDLSGAQSGSQTLWAAAIAVGAKVIRPKMLPRTVTDANTPFNAAWANGGNARAFNAWLDTQYNANILAMSRNSLRAGSTEGTDAFYQWNSATNTGDFTHPNTAGYVLDAGDFRTFFATLT